MTSIGSCANCQGEVRLYEEHWTEFGKEWTKFEGQCPNCGCWVSEFPKGYTVAYDKAEAEFYRQKEQREYYEKYKDMTFKEYLRSSHDGIYHYPFYIAQKGERTAIALTEEEAYYVGCRLAGGNSDFKIQRGGEVIRECRSPPSATTIGLDIEFYIPRWKYDEDGDRFEFKMTVPDFKTALRIIDEYRWGQYFQFTIHGSRETMLAVVS